MPVSTNGVPAGAWRLPARPMRQQSARHPAIFSLSISYLPQILVGRSCGASPLAILSKKGRDGVAGGMADRDEDAAQ